ncbi:MAG TPA: hypothetical protein DCQ64_18100 [Candidatus Rokubacteria bacterium]|nr:hypothetical protein [Candidatus Rokubacteria bacterium]
MRVNTGDHTIGGLVLSCASALDFEEVDSYTEEPGARLAGHGYTISCTIDYTARVVPIGGS